MGRKKSLVWQASNKLSKMTAYGQSKHEDKIANNGKPAREKIYSRSTLKNYSDVCCSAMRWIKREHPECGTLDEARKYVPEYLKMRIDKGLSAWTIRRDASGLAKLYQCGTTELGVELPSRCRGDVTQHRSNSSKGHFDVEEHKDLLELCRATGLRRHEVEALKPDDVIRRSDGAVVVHVAQGKGGKERYVTALNDAPARLAEQAINEGRKTVIDKEHITSHAPIHEWRAEYARMLYFEIARDVKDLPSLEVYYCRKDRVGEVFDKRAMKVVSEQLGHSRLDVVTSYL